MEDWIVMVMSSLEDTWVPWEHTAELAHYVAFVCEHLWFSPVTSRRCWQFLLVLGPLALFTASVHLPVSTYTDRNTYTALLYNRGETTCPYVSNLLLYSFSMLHNKSPVIWQLKAMHIYHLTVSMSQESAQLSWSSALGLTRLQSRCRQAAFSPESVSKEESAARPIQIAGRFISLQQMSEGPGYSWAVGGPQNLEAAFSGPWTSPEAIHNMAVCFCTASRKTF